MEDYKDSFGTPLYEGDYVVFASAYNRGNTSLQKTQIMSFTDGGNPRVGIMKYRWNRETRENEWVFALKPLTGWYARAIDDVGCIKIDR